MSNRKTLRINGIDYPAVQWGTILVAEEPEGTWTVGDLVYYERRKSDGTLAPERSYRCTNAQVWRGKHPLVAGKFTYTFKPTNKHIPR